MKKLTSILLVSMLAGSLALTGCDGGVAGKSSSNSSSSSTGSASTSSASSDNSAEDNTTADDTTTGDTTTDETSEVDVSVVGLYTESGYTNSYMGYQVDLPGEYTLTKREGLVTSAGNENEDVVAASNDESLMESLAGYVDSIMPQAVFSANDGNHYITITNETTKVSLMADEGSVWDEESAIAEATMDSVKSRIEGMASEEDGISVMDVQTQTTSFVLAGTEHAAVYLSATVNDIAYYVAEIYVRSADKKVISVIDIESLGSDDIQTICNYFSAL